jgi:cytoskeletal protein RodZ
MSLDDVAKVTKIQPRILERLEAGMLDGLPAEVFVRGFVRSFARCVGLDEREALQRYAACALGSQDLTPAVRALVEVMADLAPGSATAARATPRKMHAVEVIDLAGPVLLMPPATAAAEVEAPPAASIAASANASVVAPVATAVEAPASSPPGDRDAPGAPAASPVVGSAELSASSEPAAAAAAPVPAVDPAFASRKKRSRRRRAREAAAAAAAAAATTATAGSAEATNPTGPAGPTESLQSAESADAAGAARELWAAATPAAAAPAAPWRRLARRAPAPAAPTRPSLVIDDADPDSAERVQEERAECAGTLAPRRSFLPPILLDREDRSARQGGLTLAVILLLIAATLTLSYLMRRPSASGDGMTGRDAPVLQAERG